jgi:hypothetical protein
VLAVHWQGSGHIDILLQAAYLHSSMSEKGLDPSIHSTPKLVHGKIGNDLGPLPDSKQELMIIME